MPDLFDKVSFDGTCIPEYVSSLNPKFSASADFTMEATINGDLFAALCGVDMARGKDFTVEFDKPVSVQVRHHRKKRINKKWAKRYGYKIIFERHRLLDVSVKYHEHDEMLSVRMDTLYLCNRMACGKKCTWPTCKHTTHIEYAANFKLCGTDDNPYYVEKEHNNYGKQ